MTITWRGMFAIVCPLCFLAGFVDSVAGGGGLISLPAYYLAGLPPVLAAGTNKLSACLGTLAASGQFLKGKQVALPVALLAALGAFPGSWLGTAVLQRIPEETIRVMMIAAIPVVAVVVLRKKSRWAMPAASRKNSICRRPLALGCWWAFTMDWSGRERERSLS